jgi:hypothetical protein
MTTHQSLGRWRDLIPALVSLHWGDGLTRDEMMNQSPFVRRPELELLPQNFRFVDAGAVVSYFEHVEETGPLDVSDFPPPSGYGDTSTTGMTVAAHRYTPSVGSGSGSGDTGSSAQTGVGKWGTSDHDETYK